jgi:hypothetical protein
MSNRWLVVWLLAPIVSSASTAVEAYSLFWYLRERELSTR